MERITTSIWRTFTQFMKFLRKREGREEQEATSPGNFEVMYVECQIWLKAALLQSYQSVKKVLATRELNWWHTFSTSVSRKPPTENHKNSWEEVKDIWNKNAHKWTSPQRAQRARSISWRRPHVIKLVLLLNFKPVSSSILAPHIVPFILLSPLCDFSYFEQKQLKRT